MPCSICTGKGHNITTCPSLSVAQRNVSVKRDELAQAERELASIEQQISQQEAVNPMRRAARAKKKKKPGEKGESQSKGNDTEKELSNDDACVPASGKDVPWEKIDVPGGK